MDIGRKSIKILDSIGASQWVSGLKVVTCAQESCGHWMTQRVLDVRKVGVAMGGQWYCSYGCLRPVAETQIGRLLATGLPRATHVSRMPLGLMLVNRGLLTTDQYRSASEEQRHSGEELGDVIVRLGMLNELQVTAMRAAQWNCPVFTQEAAIMDAAMHLPPTLMRLSSMAPMHYVEQERKLFVGFVYGIEYGPLSAVEQMLGCAAQPCFITSGELHARLSRRAAEGTAEELCFDDARTASEMSRILLDYSKLIRAEEIGIRRCRDFIWARLRSSRQTTDLLFNLS